MLIVPKREKVFEVLKIATPCIAEQFLLVFVNMVTVSIIGRLGKDEFVAASMSNQLVNWLQGMYIGLATGSTVVISRIWGQGDRQGTKNAFMQTFFIALALSVFIMSLTIIFQTEILSMFFGKADKNVLYCAGIYFSYSMIGMPATALTSVINAAVRGVGNNRTPFYTTAFLNVLNVSLSFLLINGSASLGIPKMGIAGAGVAIVIARYTSVLFAAFIVWATKSPILPNKAAFTVNKKTILRIFKVGLPSSLEQIVFQGGFVVMQTLLIGFGTVFQAGYQIGANLNGILNAPAMGIGVAVTVLISQALSKREFDEAAEIVSVARYIALVGFVFLGIMLFMAAPFITRIYSSDPQVIKVGLAFTRMFGLLVIPLTYFQAMVGILRGSGDVKFVALTSTAALWIMRVFMVWIISKIAKNGYLAVMVGVSSDYIFRALMYHFRVEKGEWKFIKI